MYGDLFVVQPKTHIFSPSFSNDIFHFSVRESLLTTAPVQKENTDRPNQQRIQVGALPPNPSYSILSGHLKPVICF